jgi:hypothetical protein
VGCITAAEISFTFVNGFSGVKHVIPADGAKEVVEHLKAAARQSNAKPETGGEGGESVKAGDCPGHEPASAEMAS